MANCSSEKLYSSEVFSAGDSMVIVMMILGTISSVICLILCLTRGLLLMRMKINGEYAASTLMLLGLTPTVSLMSTITLFMPRAYEISALLSSLYVSFAIWMFSDLLFVLAGGSDVLIEKLDRFVPINSPPLLCCCFCLPKVPLTKKFLFRIRALVMQIVIFKPLAAFITACLWADGRIVTGEIGFGSAAIYVSLMGAVSTVIGMYGLIQCFRLIRPLLPHFNVRAKFVVIQMTLLTCNLQPPILGFVISRTWKGCRSGFIAPSATTYIQSFLLTLEMLLLGILSFFTYKRSEPTTRLM